MTAPETDSSQLCATQLIVRPGTLPTLVFPVVGGRPPDVDEAWRYLAEPAEFFGVAMPDRSDLATALAGASTAAATAITVTLTDTAILVSRAPVTPWQPVPVFVAGDASVPHAHLATDPWWRRMAARTTSRGELDQRERLLNERGYADGLCGGVPLLGALVCQTPDGAVGVDNPEPTSILDQLTRCGALAGVERVAACPPDAERVWWVSPRFETHPVAEVAGAAFPVDADTVPSFARWS
ncbi:hypothetical protein [Mycolicibacterium madagascariense]|uniref:hypothetical protein n=1 Tax=Mycolicibacterium madagascariense TaxID=212765 RepID=UPI0013D30AE7|nr:hypothetical protein [Mycolicibacterium madagascariense]MCV7013237.1 hypothetical protein [Mycolicibacterium madagascariense]